jgi:hypothetical protein
MNIHGVVGRKLRSRFHRVNVTVPNHLADGRIGGSLTDLLEPISSPGLEQYDNSEIEKEQLAKSDIAFMGETRPNCTSTCGYIVTIYFSLINFASAPHEPQHFSTN